MLRYCIAPILVVGLAGCATPQTRVLPPYSLANGATFQDVVTVGGNGKATAPVLTAVNTYELKGKHAHLVSSSLSQGPSMGSVVAGAVAGGLAGGIPAAIIQQGATAQNTTNMNITTSSQPQPQPSDRRLKRDIVRLGALSNGLGIYRFRYLWSDEVFVGVMAQEVREIMPDAIVVGDDGFMRVRYDRIGIEMLSWPQWLARLDAGLVPSQALDRRVPAMQAWADAAEQPGLREDVSAL